MSFRFSAGDHAYIDTITGAEIPSITWMLKEAGLVETRWFTDESRERGSCVHRLVADFDLGSLTTEDLPLVNSLYKGFLLAHVAAMDIIQPRWVSIEERRVHETLRFAGTPDRVGTMYGAVAVVEIKSGALEPAHSVQLALQAILVEPEVGIPAEAIPRYGLYLRKTGKWTLQSFPDTRKDFREARSLIKRFC